MNYYNVSWKEYHECLNGIKTFIKTDSIKYSLIVGITRGGLIPAVNLSHDLGIKMVAFNPALPFDFDILVGEKSLFVDDIHDEGKTFWHIEKLLATCCINNYGFAALHNKMKKKIAKLITKHFNFSYNVARSNWVVYPWETKESSKG